MMQQIAAQKTDLAGLPFAASTTAQAVESGIGNNQQSLNNEAFRDAFSQAKDSALVKGENQSVGNVNESNSAQRIDVHRHKTDDPTQPYVNDNTEYRPDADNEARNSTGKDANALEQENLKSHMVGDKRTSSDEQTAALSANAKDPYAGAIGLPVDDAQSDSDVLQKHASTVNIEDADTDAQSETNWLAFVESVIGEKGKGTLNTDALPEDTIIPVGGLPTDQQADTTTPLDSDSAITTGAEGKASDPDMPDLPRLNDDMSKVKSATLLSLEKEMTLDNSGIDGIKSQRVQSTPILTPDVSLMESEAAVAQQLASQLEKYSSKPISEEAKKAIADIAALLVAQQAGSQQSEHSHAGEKINAGVDNVDASLTALVAKFSSQVADNQNGKANAATTLSNDAELAVQLINDELVGATEREVKSAEESIAALASTNTSTRGVAQDGKGLELSQVKREAHGSQSTFTQDTTAMAEDVLHVISTLSPEAAQKATESLAERIAASLSSGVTPQQQQSLKTNIIAGINEFQQQVAQGREPGIDIAALVANAANEAGLSQSNTQAMMATIDTQVGQFMQLVNQSQQSAQSVFQSQLVQTDTQLVENNQARVESSKTQQQLDGFDKAVNIHKPEGQQQLNEKIRWMVNARNTMAEIRLDPPELGSMQVRVNVSGDAASVSFVVQSQQAKDALAESMPRLREMLSEQGIELGDAHVQKDNSSNGESGQQFAGQGNGGAESNNQHNDGMDDNTTVIEQGITRELKGGIDFYA
ncbi:flagellar hook-length control protein FliK [Alteromonas sp. A079]|uniref:flagellar hook-length control protein FliK n=1 Tax=Alteromonas sp. A079 TaxID=3410268 RepID=UPI003B9DE685